MEPICLIARSHNVVSSCSTLRRRVEEAAFHAVDHHRLRIARRRRIARSCAAISRSKYRTRLRARAATFPRQRGPCLSPPIVAIARENSILCFCFSCRHSCQIRFTLCIVGPPYFGLLFRIVGPPYFGVHSVFRIVYSVFHTSFWVQICIPYYVSAPSMIHSSLV